MEPCISGPGFAATRSLEKRIELGRGFWWRHSLAWNHLEKTHRREGEGAAQSVEDGGLHVAAVVHRAESKADHMIVAIAKIR